MRAPLAVVVAVAVAAGSARAVAQAPSPGVQPAAVTPPPGSAAGPGAAAPGAPPSPAPAAPEPAVAGGDPAAAPVGQVVGPVPTADATPAASDHDAVVGHIGIEARRFDAGPLPLTLRPGLGCPLAATSCEVTMGVLAARYWWTRNFALNGGLAFAAGGGRSGMVALDTYYGVGPILGMSVLLGNWRHLAVSASPEVGYVWFRPGAPDAGGRTTMLSLRGALEAELHFGFVGVPALSIGLIAGMRLQYESAAGTRLWSVGVIGDGSVWDALTNLYVRYYL